MSTFTLHNLSSAQTRLQLSSLPPLSLYVHIPWCIRKCPYCDFNSHQADNAIPEQQYIAALINDLESALPLIWGRKVQTVFFGGGTPSLLSGEAMHQLLTQLRMLLALKPMTEITLEANPGTTDSQRFADFRQAGINRLSLGIQSFNDQHLQQLDRIHDSSQAKTAIQMAQQHFDNINLDLMYALPQQSLDQAIHDIDSALSFQPQHLSCYQLTLEPNTLFHHSPPELPDDDSSFAMQLAIEQKLAAHDYQHYETSAFAQADKHSRHNMNYWQFGDYLGIGAGAHSKLSFHDKVIRQMRYKQPQQYMQQAEQRQPIHNEQQVSVKEISGEFMMNALRLNQGFDPALFQQHTGIPIALINTQLQQAEQRGLIERQAALIKPTAQGRHFLNELLTLFI